MAEALDAGAANKLKARATYVGACVNVLQTLIKIGFGMLTQSAALIADGIHSLSDLLSDMLVIIAVRLGSREPDHEHPYGHRRFETIATVILGGTLCAIGAAIIWSVAHRATHPENFTIPDQNAIAIALVSIMLNEWLYHYTKRIARLTRSKLLLANAWHQRSDAFSSLVVVIGLGGVMLGYVYADAIAAVVVALMVAKMGIGLVINSIQELVDTSLAPSMVADIRQAIMAIDGVEDIHLLRTRRMGEDALIDAHIVVDPRITVSEGHAIGDAVRDDLIKRFDDIMDVLVHVDPENDESFSESHTPLSRSHIQWLLKRHLPDYENTLVDFKIHYLDGSVEIEIILPFALSASPDFDRIAEQCRFLQADTPQIKHIALLFKI